MRLKLLAPLPLALLFLPLLGAAALAQEPENRPEPAATEPAASGSPAEAAPAQPAEPERAPRRRRAPKQRVVAIHAGHVHPIVGPAIENGVVLVRGDRIAAVGADGDIEVPADAETVTFQGAHVYPGLVDASSDAFTDDAVRTDGSLDAGAALVDALRRRGDREDELVRTGITTIYVGGRSGSPWSGIGAIVRPNASGFTVFAGKERAAVGMRLAAAAGPTHPLQRQQQIDAAFGAFTGLDEYRKKLEEHDKALEKYKKDFDEYVAFFEKKNGKKDEAAPAAPAGAEGAAPHDAQEAQPGQRGAGQRGGRGRRGGGERPTPDGDKPKEGDKPAPDKPNPDQPNPDKPAPDKPAPDKPAPAPGQEPKGGNVKPAEPKPAGEARPGDAKPAATEDKAPERPKYPKAPPRDPAKDALLQVLDGTLPLRAEVVRPDEIRGAIAAAREKKVPVLVLEQVLGGKDLARELATAAVPCVLTNLWPATPPTALEAFDPLLLPIELQRAGVAFAIATGSARRGAALPLMAACAVGNGLDADAALRAITLTPAEILGVQKDVGSLQQGKLADLLVCDRPLLQSDCRVLAVWSAGESQYEVKEPR